MNRPYPVPVKLHNSVAEWKEDYLYLFSDMHKDAYGFRPRGYYNYGWMFDAKTTMEEVMAEDHRVYAEVLREIARDKQEAIVWATKMWVHAQRVLEAKCEPSGVVFDNPDWDYECERSTHWAMLSKQLGAEDYYFNTYSGATIGDVT